MPVLFKRTACILHHTNVNIQASTKVHTGLINLQYGTLSTIIIFKPAVYPSCLPSQIQIYLAKILIQTNQLSLRFTFINSINPSILQDQTFRLFLIYNNNACTFSLFMVSSLTVHYLTHTLRYYLLVIEFKVTKFKLYFLAFNSSPNSLKLL